MLFDGDLTEGKPSAPLNVTATSSGACATITWLRPRYMPPVAFSYFIQSTDSLFSLLHALNNSSTSELICNLVAGSNYSFVVQASNIYGASPFSAASNSVTITVTQPSAPVNVLQPAVIVNVSNCLEIVFSVSWLDSQQIAHACALHSRRLTRELRRFSTIS